MNAPSSPIRSPSHKASGLRPDAVRCLRLRSVAFHPRPNAKKDLIICTCECGEHAWTNLSRGFVTMFDVADIPVVSEGKWSTIFKKKHYAIRKIASQKRQVSLHRALMGEPAFAMVDHIDRDGLNNRRSNLRLATPKANAWNSRKRNSSGFIGVIQRPSGRWGAAIGHGSQRLYLGTYDTAEEAAAAYDGAAVQRYGDFAVLNFARKL